MDGPSTSSSPSSLTILDVAKALPAMDALPQERGFCSVCNKRNLHYCASHFKATFPATSEYSFPNVRLPLKLDIIRDSDERAESSTAAHAMVLAPDFSRIFYLPDEVPKYADPSRVLVLFPSTTSVSVTTLPDLSAYDTVVVIDSTWQKGAKALMSSGLMSHPFTHVHISAYHTLFWRYQPLGAHCLSTIEATYFFFREWLAEEAKRRRRRRRDGLVGEIPAFSSGGGKDAATSTGILEGSMGHSSSVQLKCNSTSSSSSSEREAGESTSSTSSSAATRLSSNVSSSSSSSSSDSPATLSSSALYSSPESTSIAGHDADSSSSSSLDALLLLFVWKYNKVQHEYTKGSRAGHTFHKQMREGYIKYEEGGGSESNVAAGSMSDGPTGVGGDSGMKTSLSPGPAGEGRESGTKTSLSPAPASSSSLSEETRVNPSKRAKFESSPESGGNAASSNSSSSAASTVDGAPKAKPRYKGAWVVRTDIMDQERAEQVKKYAAIASATATAAVVSAATLRGGKDAVEVPPPSGTKQNES